jgi:transcriptional regulator with XRE-family HTH domain
MKTVKPKASEIELIYQQLGLRIRSVREAIGLSQDELAKRIGLSRPSMVNVEAGNQRLMLHSIESIAKALGTTVRHLLKGIWL